MTMAGLPLMHRFSPYFDERTRPFEKPLRKNISKNYRPFEKPLKQKYFGKLFRMFKCFYGHYKTHIHFYHYVVLVDFLVSIL